MQLPALDGLDTLPKLLLYNAANWPHDTAMREKEFGIWRSFDWQTYRDQVRAIFFGLKSLGLERGEVVAIMGRNRPNWVWSALAAQSAGAMSIGVYADVLGDEAAYLLNYAASPIIFAEDEEQVDKLLELGTRLEHLRWIIFHDDRGMRKYEDPRLVGWSDLMARGAELAKTSPKLFEEEIAKRPWQRDGDFVHDLRHHRQSEAGYARTSCLSRTSQYLSRG